jgi:hypothetical protein
MAALISRNTDLKSLRYGRDRIGGGSSNQPYIKSPIPDNSSSLDRTGGVDFLLRGGTLTPSRSIEDVSRLTKMFSDFKSPNGVLFIAKQNLLSRTGVKTQASGIINEGVYLPTSTLLQAGGNAFGTHLLKQGINPFRNTSPDDGVDSLFGLRDPLGLPVYTQVVKSSQSVKSNRLVQLANKKLGVSPTPLLSSQGLFSFLRGLIFQKPTFASIPLFSNSSVSPEKDDKILLRYGGGPGSILGIGKTIIKQYSDTTQGIKDSKNTNYNKNYYGITNFSKVTPTQTSLKGTFTLRTNYQIDKKTNTDRGLSFNIIGNNIFKGKYYVLDAKTIFNRTTSKNATQISDFRKAIPASQVFSGGVKNILSNAPDYRTKNIENRVNLGDPGKRNKNVSSYTNGLTRLDGTKYGALDKITAMPLYQSDKGNHSGNRNDLVKFSIGIIDNNLPDKRTYIHFRAFLDSMEDNYNAQWDSFKYMGRGENFYRYNGFNRNISLSWTIAAQSKEELIPMYQKLNFLASSLAPDFSANGYMRGNLAVLTVGGYLFEQPGIINSINYSVPSESPWEIGISDTAGFDNKVKELPHIIKVTGFSFTPIHTFVPRLQQNKYEGFYGDTNGGVDNAISSFGYERFIALSKDTSLKADTTNYNQPNDYTFGGPNTAARRQASQDSVQADKLSRRINENREPSLTTIDIPPNTQGVILRR